VPDRISVLLENDLRADTQQLSSVGKDAIDELKARVRHSLAEKVGERVRKSCQMFVKRGEDVGRGVKDRMHAFIEGELAEAVLDAARPVAISVLKENYAEVQHEVEAALKTLVDPIERAKELVVDREAKNRLNTDRKQRERLLQSLNSVTPSLAA
jgi:nucleotidyltransferase/DNA polymerase involved in DNA repair